MQGKGTSYKQFLQLMSIDRGYSVPMDLRKRSPSSALDTGKGVANGEAII